MSVLAAQGIVKRYGGVVAVDGVDLRLAAGEVVGLIGPNGAGKTTLFDCVSGFTVPDAGRVEVAGRDVTRLAPEQRARLGLGRTFQRLELFTSMTVVEHLLVAAEERHGGGWLRTSRAARAAVDDALVRFRLGDVADVVAAELPTGTLRRVEVARAWCTEPRVLLLDEPASGLDPREVRELAGLLRGLGEGGRAALVVEHDVGFVLDVVDRVVVLAAGTVIAAGSPGEVVADAAVRSAYLGEVTR